MASRTTLPTRDLLSLVGAGAAASPAVAPPPASTPREEAPPPEPSPDLKGEAAVAQRRIRPRGQGATAPRERARSASVTPLPAKEKFNCRIASDLADRVRDCVVALSGPPHRLTIDGFAAEAFRRELERLKKLENDAADFPKRAYDPKPGRPIGG
jgi:hypothetical protein